MASTAASLRLTLVPTREFDRIVFNLPQAPVIQGARNKIQRHRALLSEFCASASTALARNGQLWITLLAGQGGTCLDPLTRPVGDTWQIVHAGADAGLLLRAATHVSVDSLGYEPTGRRANQRLTPSRLRHGLLVHVFSRENEPEEPAVCGAIEWHFQNSFQTDSAAVGDDAQPAGEAMLEIARGALGSRCSGRSCALQPFSALGIWIKGGSPHVPLHVPFGRTCAFAL